jgi:hypothetical protein
MEMTKTIPLVVALSTMLFAACQLPGFIPGGGGKSTKTSHTERTEEVNGEPVEVPEELEESPRRSKKKKEEVAADDFGATCKTNKDCSGKTCFVGRGELGYCTKMCDSWSDCPSHWECERAANAPQRICMQ